MSNQHTYTSIAFLKHNAVLSSINSNVIHYCLATNTYKIFLDFSSRNPISIMKQSPKDNNLVAAGTKNGLILLVAIDKMEIFAKLRGHDTEISSLDWNYLSLQPPTPEINGKPTLETLIASTDTSDCFDIYTENAEQEFGVYGKAADSGSDDEAVEGEIQEKILSNSNFNFLEACNDLKDDMLAEGSAPSDAPKEGSKATFDDNKEQYGVKNVENPSADESLASNASSRTPVLTEESLNYLDECQRMKDFVIITKEEISQVDSIPVLASGSREPVAWLWDVNERSPFKKITWHPKPRASLPTPFTNVLWVDEKTLLVTDGNGEINEYAVSFDVNTKTLTTKEQKDKKFDIKGVLNMCLSNDGSVIWTSSIHRHISCFNVKEDFKKIVSLDTIQLRIHYIVENPIDSNVIAIGGNDKRICLWNTSEASKDVIGLRPFMNKIHSGVLCLSWHPEKDNVLAFSTREGRIGILDVNKSSNVPTILTTFSSQEVYSIAWTKIKDSFVLIACNGHKFVYYEQKNQWKMKNVDHLKHSASVAVNGNIIAIGNGNGDLLFADISKEFYVLLKKKACRKYVGMMSWHGDTLAISTENGIVLIKAVDANISELPEEKLLKLYEGMGRVFSVRFNKTGSLLVSCCVNGYVTVWDLETLLPLSSFNLDTLAYSAIFLPSNEDVIVCGGQDSTVVTYEWRKLSDVKVELIGKKKPHQHFKNVQWAVPTEVTKISKNSQRRQKTKIAKAPDALVNELSTDIVKLNLQTKKTSSIFHAANREISTDPLEFLELLLSGRDRETTSNEKIFGDRDSVKEAIHNEIQQGKQLNLKTNGGIVLPQLNDTLKDDIIERMMSRTLTEVHVAVAPSISFE